MEVYAFGSSGVDQIPYISFRVRHWVQQVLLHQSCAWPQSALVSFQRVQQMHGTHSTYSPANPFVVTRCQAILFPCSTSVLHSLNLKSCAISAGPP